MSSAGGVACRRVIGISSKHVMSGCESQVRSGAAADGLPSAGDSAGYLKLFRVVCRALTFGALRFKPRERQFALLLAVESFGEYRDYGAVELEAWALRLPEWRSNELRNMLRTFRVSTWLTLDAAGGIFWLAPDRWPGWLAAAGTEWRHGNIGLRGDAELHEAIARGSQAAAVSADVAKISQQLESSIRRGEIGGFAKISQSRAAVQHVPETCNSGSTQKLHVHVPKHVPVPVGIVRKYNVGELAGRSADEMVADIVRLDSGMRADRVQHWRRRIEENARLVNDVIREAQLQRGHIRNMGGWMNSVYLKGVRN